MFSVELLDLQKSSALNIFSVQREFWVYLGGFVLFVWRGYELYCRAVKQNEDLSDRQKGLCGSGKDSHKGLSAAVPPPMPDTWSRGGSKHPDIILDDIRMREPK